MGLDGVELILAIEDGFQIHITDGEASAVTTVGNLHDLVVSRLEGQGSKRCLTSAAFYRTRRGIIEALGLPREDVRPSTVLENILPEKVRREQWRRIQDSMSLKLPDLRHPGTSVSTLLAIGMMLTIGPGLYAHVGVGGLALLSFLGLIMGALLVKFTPTLATAFPHRAATVGDLARDVVAANHGRLVAEIGAWNRNEVWDILCRIIATQTGVEREQITREARIVDDLGIE